MKIAVIGGGWYGSHIALQLAQKGYSVTLYEKNSHLFSEISGLFGIRLHIGPHYPRSATTRRSCLYGFHEFTSKYPELIVAHDYSVYAVGKEDTSGNPSKVTVEEFIKVCQEHSKCKVSYNIEEKGYDNLQVVVELAEPSVYVGRGLHDFFQERLFKSNVTIHCNYDIKSVRKIKDGEIEVVSDEKKTERFDHVVNATSFQALLPRNRLSLPFEIFYQPCLALVYEDTQPTSEKPFSFIVMDGWYPCMMPAVEYGSEQSRGPRRYILTHGIWTIMASYTEVSNAKKHLTSIDDKFIDEQVRPSCEREINRFFPSFENRFKYIKWIGAVLAKIKNNQEFRSSITLQDAESRMIYVLPGKVSNIFDAETEVEALIRGENVIHNEDVGYSYVKDGTLNAAFPEFKEEIMERNTCDLQTFRIETDEKEIVPPPIDKKAITTASKQRPWLPTFSIEKLLFAMVAVFIINEFRENPNQLARYSLGLAILAASFIAVTNTSDFSSNSFTFFNQLSARWRRGGKDYDHDHVQDQGAKLKFH